VGYRFFCNGICCHSLSPRLLDELSRSRVQDSAPYSGGPEFKSWTEDEL
jgi:hypothetical protein